MAAGAEVTFSIFVDAQQRIVHLPRGLSSLLGISAESDAAIELQALLVEDASNFLPKEAGAKLTRTAYLKHSKGEILPASLDCVRLPEPHDLVCIEFTITGKDTALTDTVDKESLDFLTTVSHELRVALNGVIGFANLLGSSDMDADQHAILDKLQSCNHLLKGLINDILEYSRVATSKISFRSETVNIDKFVREVVDLFRERARKKGLELRLEIGSDADVVALLPRMRVTQVLSNLIANAIKFTAKGWVSVEVFCEKGMLCIGVKDTGSGIGRGQEEAIFRPFFQLGESGKNPEGTGLGLAISKELVNKMGGSLELRHPEEGGSLFAISLPLRPSSGTSETAGAQSRIKKKADVEIKPVRRDDSKRVLVVEDNQLNADILGHFLNDYGVSFDRVDNGRAAVETYRDGKYDLVLMDVMLPEMNGYEATEKILAQTQLNPPVPIVGVTAKVFRRDQVRCIESGMVEVVHKPVDFKQLRKVLDHYLCLNESGDESTLQTAGLDALTTGPLEESVQADSRVVSLKSGSLDPAVLESYISRMQTQDTNRQEILATAIGIVDAEVASLLDSIEGSDRKDIGMRAHSLKGALALLGARDILDLAKGLELVASDGRSPLKVAHWKLLIEGAYAEFKAELEKHMNTSVA